MKQQLITKHNIDTDKLKIPDIRKIMINNAKLMYKNNHKNCLETLDAIIIKKKIVWIEYHSTQVLIY